MDWNINLKGETALIVGGTRNIGLSIAEALKASGAHVCIVGGSDNSALKKALSHLSESDGKAVGLIADISDEESVSNAFNQCEEKFGRVSILVNGPGFRPHAPFTDIDLDTWNAVMSVMLTGPFLTSRELFRRLPQKCKGSIINIGGLSAHKPAKGRAHVIAAKAGIAGLTRALAAEGAGRIRANCIVPGLIDTKRKAGQPQAEYNDDEANARGTCEDVAQVVLSFACPKNTYVTGQTVHVSGGRFM
ncbi:MAG: short-chain dehydrogenase [Rhodospirillaceae bacterium]|nr:short-chain dehydrogenase [Rhodospirillaceae bacterium]|tara:strand:+ start:1152 stop:1892 length:741 start_codon:yes stop_codon:yes gene_type:complete